IRFAPCMREREFVLALLADFAVGLSLPLPFCLGLHALLRLHLASPAVRLCLYLYGTRRHSMIDASILRLAFCFRACRPCIRRTMSGVLQVRHVSSHHHRFAGGGFGSLLVGSGTKNVSEFRSACLQQVRNSSARDSLGLSPRSQARKNAPNFALQKSPRQSVHPRQGISVNIALSCSGVM